MFVCEQHVHQEIRKKRWSLETGVRDDESLYGFRTPDLGSLQEPQVLLIINLFVQPPVLNFNTLFIERQKRPKGGLLVKSTCLSLREPRFNFQQSHCSSQQRKTPVPVHPTASSDR